MGLSVWQNVDSVWTANLGAVTERVIIRVALISNRARYLRCRRNTRGPALRKSATNKLELIAAASADATAAH